MMLAVLALAVGCSGAPVPTPPPPAGAGRGALTPAAPASASASPGSAPWRALAPLTREQLTTSLLSVADLPPGSTIEPDSSTADPLADSVADATRRYPACAPLLTAIFERPAESVRVTYVTGNNTLANRTEVGLASFPAGRSRERFDVLEQAVYGRGCTGFTMNADAPHARVEPFTPEATEAPAVGFRLVFSPDVGSQGGFTLVFLYTAVGDNRILFGTSGDTTPPPVLRTDLVTAQIHRLTTASG
ncbi:hypothetical protein ACFZDG_33840 [Kitasatospora xanthocidica]|uniref:hypothetical protein n=1 Tax=Kitasatospora xanthocidica TaxID=83382 RepID=UPI0036ED3BF5